MIYFLIRQLDDLEQKKNVSKYETAELERTQDELVSAVENMQRENGNLVRPQLIKLENSLALAKEQLK